MPRKPIIAGNWKMNKGGANDAKALAAGVATAVKDLLPYVDVAVCPPYTALDGVRQALEGTGVALGAQNTHVGIKKDGSVELEGAYTGEISPAFLKDVGVKYVILGHSERRQYFGETDQGVNRKVKALAPLGLIPIVCVGELLEERDRGQTLEVVGLQVKGCYEGVAAAVAATSVIAYEPVWAIGTGRTATPAQAQEVHAHIRAVLKGLYGAEVAEAIRIQYGGSMKPDNAKELLAQKDIDGGLIGGAALMAADFAAIVAAGKQ